MNTKKSIVAVALVAAIGVIAYYRFYIKPPEAGLGEKPVETNKELVLNGSKEVSAIATYNYPGGIDKIRFTVSLDDKGVIVGVKSTDTLKPEEVNPNLDKFTNGLSVVIKGKKLSELNNVDKIGTSSLTTDAFNKVLGELKAQI